MRSQDCITKAQYRALLQAYREQGATHETAAAAAKVPVSQAEKAYSGFYERRFPWCVAIREIIAGRSEVHLAVVPSIPKPMEGQDPEVALPVDVTELLADIGAPVESEADRKRLQNELLAINRRVTSYRMSMVAESAQRLERFLRKLHVIADQVIDSPFTESWTPEDLASMSVFAVNISRVHQAFTSQVSQVVTQERLMNPKDDAAEAAKIIPPDVAVASAKKLLGQWANVVGRGQAPGT